MSKTNCHRLLRLLPNIILVKSIVLALLIQHRRSVGGTTCTSRPTLHPFAFERGFEVDLLAACATAKDYCCVDFVEVFV
jgi:hypothetical protein